MYERGMIWLLAAVALGSSATGLAAQGGEAPEVITPFRLAAIDLDLELDYERQWIDGRATLTVENWTDAPATKLPLLVGRLMYVEAVTNPDGAALPYDQDVTTFSDWSLRQVNGVEVQLPRAVAPGDSTRVAIDYSGHLVPATETGMRYVRDHLDPAFTVLRVEAFAFPRVGAPSLSSIRSVPTRTFRFSARVTVPDTLVVATGGELEERREEGGRATYVLRSRHPVPFLNLPIAPYRVFTSGGVRGYLLPADSAGGPELMATVDQALEWFRTRYGDLDREPEFSLMEIPTGWGSQADLDGGIMIEAAALASRENRTALYHELSHLWDSPDAEAPSPRWNEGLAMYHQERVAADLDGASLTAARDEMARSVCRRAEQSDAVRVTPLAEYGEKEMTGWSYTVGAVLFYVLDDLMGRDRFDAAYRELFQATKAGSVRVEDLARALTRADPRVEAVFRDWVYGTDWYPKLCEEHDADVPALVASYRGEEG